MAFSPVGPDDSAELFHSWLDVLREDLRSGHGFRTHPGSELDEDDVLVQGGLMSETVQLVIGASFANLDAAAQLLGSDDGVSPYPISTLIRAALEIAAVAVWLLEPDSTTGRAQRLLRLQHEDSRNEWMFGGDREHHASTSARIVELAAHIGVTAKSVTSKPSSSELVQHLDEVVVDAGDIHFLIWKLHSGFAHGRRWALRVGTVGISRGPSPRGGEVLALAPNGELLIGGCLVAATALDHAIGRWNLLSGNAKARTPLYRLPESLLTPPDREDHDESTGA
ncbi:hypothetical protein F8O01_17500 [Pseudoclavibacter chungangensis]|uniref:Uncharacterized protein n=1 Tax=Pseudoclavibacter chungangensis TaxID=587635 RepID=A0A7J5BM45_9MICO|nr:hypothetical protein [Pseudoclavibacter chungangensis]KAB1651837.1 hypothetical protein F8O01_17500 [Pseudoclavibacter chungangensis]NYJ66498.1 hypothetical protein [Pseudoclavibacter chungangensis]